MRLILSSYKTGRSLHIPSRMLKVYIQCLTGFSHVFSPDGLNNTLLSQGCTLQTARTGAEHTFKGQGRGQEPSIALVQLVGQLGVMCS